MRGEGCIQRLLPCGSLCLGRYDDRDARCLWPVGKYALGQQARYAQQFEGISILAAIPKHSKCQSLVEQSEGAHIGMRNLCQRMQCLPAAGIWQSGCGRASVGNSNKTAS